MLDCQHVDPSLPQKYVPFCDDWCETVTIAARRRDPRPSNRTSILNRTKKFISSQSIQTCSGAYADSHSICVGLVPGGVQQCRFSK